MKTILALAALTLTAGLILTPAVGTAQDAEPSPSDGGMRMLRVYMEAPYHYDIVLKPQSEDMTRFQVYIDGKEVGSADVVLDCQTRSWSQTVTQEFTGSSETYVKPLVDLFIEEVCGAAPE